MVRCDAILFSSGIGCFFFLPGQLNTEAAGGGIRWTILKQPMRWCFLVQQLGVLELRNASKSVQARARKPSSGLKGESLRNHGSNRDQYPAGRGVAASRDVRVKLLFAVSLWWSRTGNKLTQAAGPLRGSRFGLLNVAKGPWAQAKGLNEPGCKWPQESCRKWKRECGM